MQPRLMAEEAIRAANQIAVGTGSLTKEDRRDVVHSWEKAASGGTVQAERATRQRLRASGIGVRVVTKQQPTESNV
jgi:hypothetical protein